LEYLDDRILPFEAKAAMGAELKIVLFAILATLIFVGGGVIALQLQKPNCPLGMTAEYNGYKPHRGWRCTVP
jgi:hypothetical protein